jgi:type IV pilus assembly protein PilW
MSIKTNQKLSGITNKGFTLIELLVAVAIFSLVIAGIWTNFISQKKIYHSQQQTAMIQQNIRGAMFLMEKQLRMAGYDPGSKGYGISNIQDNAITFNFDDNAGGVTSIRYFLNNTNLMMSIDGGAGEVLAENIYNSGGEPGFAIAYAFDADRDGCLDTVDGSPSGDIIWAMDSDDDNDLDLRMVSPTNWVALAPDVSPEAIKAVRIWLLAQGDRPDSSYHDNNTYVVGRNAITTDDRIRRRLLSCIVKCRNL